MEFFAEEIYSSVYIVVKKLIRILLFSVVQLIADCVLTLHSDHTIFYHQEGFPMSTNHTHYTLRGELALVLAVIINSLGVVLMLHSGSRYLRHLQRSLRIF